MPILPQHQSPMEIWSEVAPKMESEIRRPLEKVLATANGGVLSREESLRLAECRSDELIGMAAVADLLRKHLVGDSITYVVNRNINFTNICFVGCKFCAFFRGPNHPEANFYSPEQVAYKAAEAKRLGATEVCIQGGLPPNLPKYYYRDLLRAVKDKVPEIHIHAFSPMEVMYGVQLTGMPIRDYLAMLKDNGLDTLPGTAAEILHDDVRQLISKHKLSAMAWEEIICTAHSLGIRTTSTLMYGHVERSEHWADQLLKFQRIQSITGGFTEFVPLGFVHKNTRLYLEGLARPGPTPEEHIRIHALGRIMLAGYINNVQVSWVKLTMDMAEQCFRSGANDFGGTLMEENISRLAGSDAGQYVSPEEFNRRIRKIGRIPAQRNTAYTKITPQVH